MAKALVSLDTIALDIAADLGDSTGKYRFTLLRKLLEGYREFHLYVDQDFSVKTAVLEYDNTVNLPSDFVYETKVGILYQGYLAVLTLDKNVQKQRLSQEESESQLNNIWCGNYGWDIGYPFYNCYRGSEFLGELYGLGRGVPNAGFYNLDRKDGVIYIGSLVPEGAEVVVEYKSDGISEGLKLVPTEIVMALKYYAKSEFYADKNPNQSQINRSYYEREYNKVKRLYNFRSALYMSQKINESFSPTNY